MIETAEPRAPPTGPPSLTLVPCADMEILPPELVTAILEFLEPDDLRRAAAVSRLWYASAWCAGRSLSIKIFCDRAFPGSKPALLDEVVQHALRNSRRLRLSVKLTGFDNTHWSAFKAIVSSIEASLPVLVYLSVSVSRGAVSKFVSALLQPAPYLREFVFLLEQHSTNCRVDVPGDLFGGEAPKLHRLMLDRIPLGQAPVPAFAQVTALHMICIFEIPDIEYAEHFPCLLDMHLAFHTTPRGAPTPASFRFGGLRLHRLVIEDLDFCAIIPAVIRSIDVSAVPVFEHVGTKLHPDDPLWKQQDPGALSLRIMRSRVHESRFSMLVAPAHRRWQRAYHMSPGYDEPCPISELPALLRVGQCVTYLRIIDDHVAALLETGWPDLAALRELRVDCYGYGSDAPVVWPPPQYTPYGRPVPTPERGRCARCPALETLTLATRNGAMVLETRHVVQLGGALAQCERDARERAELVLVGIELNEPADAPLLRTAFSSVRSCLSDESWDRDGGLWAEEQ